MAMLATESNIGSERKTFSPSQLGTDNLEGKNECVKILK